MWCENKKRGDEDEKVVGDNEPEEEKRMTSDLAALASASQSCSPMNIKAEAVDRQE